MTSASSRTDLRACALAYARRGWPVFPLKPKDKTPLTNDGFKSAVPREGVTIQQAHDLVLAWWSQWPDANIGIATGIAFDVLDIDGSEGRQALHEYLRSKDAAFYKHPGPVSRTGKGAHLLFTPTGFGNRAKLLGAPLDFRGLGGYIVAPPSVHPLGHRYCWDEGRTETAPLPEATAWLIDLVGSDPAKGTERKGLIFRENNPDPIPTETLVGIGKIVATRPDIIEVATKLDLSPIVRTSYALVRCPFHDDSTPSMVLYPNNTFHCFGCQANGDSYDLQRRQDMHGRNFI